MILPITHAIKAFLQFSGDGRKFPGVAHVMDFGDGSTTHSFAAHFQNLYGATATLHGVLENVQFNNKETRGAPKKKARDIALGMAFEWHQTCHEVTPAEARKKVLALWSDNHWGGITDATHLNRKLREIKKPLENMIILAVNFGENPKSKVIALPESAVNLVPFQYVRADGEGWVWEYGKETAKFGELSFNALLNAQTPIK